MNSIKMGQVKLLRVFQVVIAVDTSRVFCRVLTMVYDLPKRSSLLDFVRHLSFTRVKVCGT